MTEREKVKKSKVYKSSDSSPLANNDGKERVYTHKYPQSILTYSNANQRGKVHPTQKPVELFEYLIKTYTDENDIVLDNCMGSGTTAIAAINTNRNYIGFELDENYYKIANERIKNHLVE
jgi:site-specific DNA-methyltransferase (adenine-specific)